MKKILLATAMVSLLSLNAGIGASAAESEDYTEYDVARPMIPQWLLIYLDMNMFILLLLRTKKLSLHIRTAIVVHQPILLAIQ